jgi:small conductance mechanosensitive channel
MNEISHRFTERFYNWVVTFGPRLVIALLILFIGQWAIGLVVKLFNNFLKKRKLNPTIKPFIINLLKTLLQVLLIFSAMQLLGIKMTIFAALIGAFGVAAGLALSGTLQNFTSGILIILLKPFRVGDNIKTQGEEGTVTSIQLFYTNIVTYNNTTLIVPNSKLSNEVIFNLTLKKERRMDVVLKFNTGVDFQEVKQIFLHAVNDNKNILKIPASRIGIKEIEAGTYTVMLNVWLNAHGFEDSKMEINEILLNQLKILNSATSV